MASYRHIVEHTLKWEGGLVYHAGEGQWTNKGIQWDTYAKYASELLGRVPTMDHFKQLADLEAAVFIAMYWDKATNNNTIISQQAANLMFYAFWGSGYTGIKKMQQALNDAYNAGLSVDGVVGPKTVEVINSHQDAPQVLYSALENNFKRLASENPARYAKYLNGWLNRLRELKPSGMIGALGLIGVITILLLTL